MVFYPPIRTISTLVSSFSAACKARRYIRRHIWRHIKRGPENEGPGNILVLAQAVGAGGRGRFKDDPVRAGLTDWAQPRFTTLENAHQPPERHSECASQRVALADGGEQ